LITVIFKKVGRNSHLCANLKKFGGDIISIGKKPYQIRNSRSTGIAEKMAGASLQLAP